jgi:putative ATPase
VVNRERFLSPMPLAARMRPERIEDVLGQANILADGTPLRRLIESKDAGSTSLVLWGPPGVGKTTLARLIASTRGAGFKQLSAISAGVKEVREIVDEAKKSALYETKTVLFLDEIHRFTKSQQDSLLPSVESGDIQLVAATTENPAFAVIQPLLSRSLTLSLTPLADSEVMQLLTSALQDPRGYAGEATLDADAAGAIVKRSGGDARRALTVLESSGACAYERDTVAKTVRITLADVETSTSRTASIYDRAGDAHYDVISAFIKSVRGSDVDAALFYLARMIDGGEDPQFIARRLIILASEDVGLADPTALNLAVSTAQAVALIGMPEGRIPLSQATIYLALAPKSNSAYQAINAALQRVRTDGAASVPLHLRGTGYADAASQGHGVGYKYSHDSPGGVVEQRYLPDEFDEVSFYKPKELGKEAELAPLWVRLRKIIRGK